MSVKNKIRIQKMLWLLLIAPVFTFSHAAQAKVYQCKNSDGTTSYQEHPCESDTIKTLGGARKVSEEQMLMALAKMTGKSQKELQDPKYRQAAEALVVVDAGKAYAFSLVHAAPLKYCGSSARAALNRYKAEASDAILLGKHYYTEGIDLMLGERHFVKTGHALSQALRDMINKHEKQHASMNDEQKKYLCRETEQALEMLTSVYKNS